ncbi:hypothetical protein JCM10207_005476 [Rhodosporidiobolus poonsookiae]
MEDSQKLKHEDDARSTTPYCTAFSPDRPAPHPSSNMPAINIIHWFGAFLLLAATAVLIVASVSAPIWDTVGFLKGTVNGRDITFGNWGWCSEGQCSSAGLGYDRNFIDSVVGTDGVGDAVIHGLSKTLVLTPICAGLSFIALLFALSTHLAMGIVASLLSLLAFIVTIVSLGLDLGVFVTARNRINDRIANSDVHLASCIWLVVAAAGCQLIAALTVCFTRSRRRAARRDAEFATVPAMQSSTVDPAGRPSTVGSTGPLMAENETVPATTSGKRHFWQRNKNTAAY